MCVPWELNPQTLGLLTQCSTTEPQEHLLSLYKIIVKFVIMLISGLNGTLAYV